MKNIKIYPKDWLQLHPYKQSGPADFYYTQIANRIDKIMDQTKLANSFEKEEIRQVCMRMAAYFEDIISGLNIWRSFLMEYKRLYGQYIPFYTPNDHYYDDEVNYEDIRLLLWHYTQQYHGQRNGTFVSPDNEANGKTAQLIYDLFCEEWTTAPENEEMQKLFAPETRYVDPEKYNNLLYWFHYQSYLFTDNQKELSDTIKEYWRLNPGNQENQAAISIHNSLAHVSKGPFLAYTAPKWLSLILPATHPDHDLFVAEGEKAQSFIDPSLEKAREMYRELYTQFLTVSDGQPLIYMKSKQEFLDFMNEKMNIDPGSTATNDLSAKKFALYVTPTDGIQLLVNGIEYIKDENNPFYNEEKAKQQALSFFIVKHCSAYLLKELAERKMLVDAQTKSLTSPERGKAIIQDNWQFLSRYFLREYV